MKEVETKRRVRPVMNVAWNYGVLVFTAVTSFFLSPFIVHHLGNDAYGTWALLGSLIGYLGLLDLGVRGAVMRYVASTYSEGDDESAGRYASAGLAIFSLTAVIVLVGGSGFAVTLDRFFNIPPDLIFSAKIAVLLGAATMSVGFVGGVYGGIVIGLERFDLNGSVEITVQAFRVIAVLILLGAGYGIVALAGIHLVGGIATALANVLLSRRLYPELDVSLQNWDRSAVGKILDFSIVSTILRGASIIIRQIDAVVIGIFHPPALIAFYAIGSTLVSYAIQILSAITTTITPRVSSLQGSGRTEDTRRIPLMSARVASLILLPVVATFLTRGHTFIGLWMGPDYADPSGDVLFILAVGLWIGAARAILVASFLGLDRHRTLLAPICTEALLNLGLSLFLVQDYGIRGVAWGTTLPMVVISLTWLPFIYIRVLGVSMRAVALEVFVRPYVAMIPFLVGSILMDQIATRSLLTFFLQVALLLPLAAAGSWVAGLKEEERDQLRDPLVKLLSRMTPWR